MAQDELTAASLELVEQIEERHRRDAGWRGSFGSLQIPDRCAVIRVKMNEPLH